eukprot:Rhum_TRINITY_DN15926_c0_g2::Rhum_TRINITY_DN15926_c0_g2_i1::g.162473::m.162473
MVADGDGVVPSAPAGSTDTAAAAAAAAAEQQPQPSSPLAGSASDGWRPGLFLSLPRDHPAHAQVDAFYSQLQWTQQSLARRQRVVSRLEQKVKRRLPGIHTQLFGSTLLKTYLPDGDVDITLCQTDAQDDSKAKELEVLRILMGEILPNMISEPAELINAEVKLVKCVVDDLQVDITIDQYGGVTTVDFLERVTERVGNNGLFKRALILIKAWACYEALVLGANGGLLGSYSLTVMLIAVFQQLDTLQLPHLTPLDVLQAFLEYYSAFDFSRHALSVLGAVPLAPHDLRPSAAAAVAAAVLAASAASLLGADGDGGGD